MEKVQDRRGMRDDRYAWVVWYGREKEMAICVEYEKLWGVRDIFRDLKAQAVLDRGGRGLVRRCVFCG